MDLLDPSRSVTSTLDGMVLALLAQAGRPLTAGEVASQAVRGSEIGIRKSLARLVLQGTVKTTVMGRNCVHELNRDHIAAPIATLLSDLRNELWRRFREELSNWDLIPVMATVFGSAARHDGGTESDIDLLLVHPPLVGEQSTDSNSVSMRQVGFDLLSKFGRPQFPMASKTTWQHQLDDLRRLVQSWTGNRLQIVDISYFEWLSANSSTRKLLDEISKAKVDLVGPLSFTKGGPTK